MGSHTVVDENLVPGAIVNLDIILGATVNVQTSELEVPADGTSTSDLTITVQEGGEGVTGDTVTLFCG